MGLTIHREDGFPRNHGSQSRNTSRPDRDSCSVPAADRNTSGNNPETCAAHRTLLCRSAHPD
jgi:hypothetical protein